MGDGGDYEAFGDDLDAAIDALLAYNLGPVEMMNWIKGGLDTALFPAPGNYISLYYGDQAGNYSHDLDAHERKQVLAKLAKQSAE